MMEQPSKLEFPVDELLPVLPQLSGTQRWWERFFGEHKTVTPALLEKLLDEGKWKLSTKGAIAKSVWGAIRRVYGPGAAQLFRESLPRRYRNCGVVMETGWSTRGQRGIEMYTEAMAFLQRLCLGAYYRRNRMFDVRLRQMAYLVIIYRTGLRRGEFLQLRNRMNFLRREDGSYVARVVTLKQRRGNVERTVAFKPVGDWEQYAVDYLYNVVPEGEPLATANQLLRLAALTQRRLGWRISFHALRHARATLAANGGVPLPALAKFLGHTNLQNLRFYVEPQDGSIEISQIG